MEDAVDVSNVPPVTYIRGFPLPGSKRFNKEYLESAFDYLPKDGDIIISTFPKTGTTWMQYIVWMILHDPKTLPDLLELTLQTAPYIEFAGAKVVEDLPHPRFYKTHFPFNQMKINKCSKYIYVYRHPRDTVVSMYHFLQNMERQQFPFESFFRRFVDGKVSYGSYFDHVLSVVPHQDEGHLLLVSYEDLSRDKRNQILRIAKFLGDHYYQALTEDESFMKRVMDSTTFEYMKSNLIIKSHLADQLEERNKKSGGAIAEESCKDENEKSGGQAFTLFRKGVVGDGKSLLTEAQISELDDIIRLKLKGTRFEKDWLE